MTTKSAPKKPAEKTPAASAKANKKRPANEGCSLCGHWSTATEYGVDEKSGYCDRWEKLTDKDFWCPDFVTRERFKALQNQLAEEHEDFLDEDS